MIWKTDYCFGSKVLHKFKIKIVTKVILVANESNFYSVFYELNDGTVTDEQSVHRPDLYTKEELTLGIRNF
jgi:hypothetical protein